MHLQSSSIGVSEELGVACCGLSMKVHSVILLRTFGGVIFAAILTLGNTIYRLFPLAGSGRLLLANGCAKGQHHSAIFSRSISAATFTPSSRSRLSILMPRMALSPSEIKIPEHDPLKPKKREKNTQNVPTAGRVAQTFPLLPCTRACQHRSTLASPDILREVAPPPSLCRSAHGQRESPQLLRKAGS